MFRLLHTADWHVGKTLARRSRADEMRAALREVVEIGRNEAVDVVVVAGDVFEHQAPSPESESIVYDALLDFDRAGIPVVIIPGNHDHPHRWRAIAPLLKRCSVEVVADVKRPSEGGMIEVASRDESTTMQIAALPWVFERRLIGAVEMMGLEGELHQSYADNMRHLLQALCAEMESGKCHVLAAHLFVSGSFLGGGERSLTVGQTYAVTPQAIPQVQYAAIGHVHRPQQVSGSPVPARYSGSLLQLDFGEVEQDKSVTVVDLEPGLPAKVRVVPITSGNKLRDVEGTLDELAELATMQSSDYLRVRVRCDAPQPGLGDQVREMLPNALEVRLDYPRSAGGHDLAGLATLSPKEQFARYYEERHQAPPGEEMLRLFEKLLLEVEDEADPA